MTIEQPVIDEIKQRITLSTVIAKRVALKKAGREFIGLCPFHNEKTPSFSVNDAKAFYHCFGCGAHGDVISFVVETESAKFPDVVARLAAECGVTILDAPPDQRGPKRELDEWHPIEHPPASAPKPDLSRWDEVYEYRDLEGYLLRYVLRRHARDGRKKQILPLTWGWLRSEDHPKGEIGWWQRHAAAPRSLYGLEDLAESDGRVIVCEGEKDVLAARRLFPAMVVVTWAAGGKAVHLADWRPLQGRNVILWPDRDRHLYPANDPNAGREKPWTEQEGFKTMMQVASLLVPLGCTIDLLDVEDLAVDGAGAADVETSLSADDAGAWLLPRLRRYDPGSAPIDDRGAPDDGYERHDDTAQEGFRHVRYFIDQYLDQVDRAAKAEPGVLLGISTGIKGLDSLLGGLQGGRLYVLGGATSSGKTLVAVHIANHAAATPVLGDPYVTNAVAIDSLEMPGAELVGRSAAADIGISSRDQLTAGVSDDVVEKLVEWAARYADRRIYIDESPHISFETLEARTRHLKQTSGLDLLVVDYLQLMNAGEGNNRAELVGRITRGMKALAKALGIPVLVLSQLSRKVDEREGNRPQKSDLRESGSIEHDADVIILVHRPEVYLRTTEPKERRDGESDEKWTLRRKRWHDRMDAARWRLELIVDKNRGGPVGDVVTNIDLALMRVDFVPEDGGQPGGPSEPPGLFDPQWEPDPLGGNGL